MRQGFLASFATIYHLCKESKGMMKTNEINIRDPFVLPHDGKYYMYGTRVGDKDEKNPFGVQRGFDVYVSEDLENWSEAKPVFEYYDGFWGTREAWAPEVHFYQGKFYMFASFKSDETCRGTAILVSDSPEGPFKEHSEGAVTPRDWECLDGTLYVSEEGTPYMIFCNEWVQVGDGTVCVVELSKDLKCAVGEPRVLWKASDVSWVVNLPGPHEKNFVTDGPYLLKVGKELLSFWSSYGPNGYAEAIVRSDNGEITGDWIPDEGLFLSHGSGHGMVFETFDGEILFLCHSPNTHFDERPIFRKIKKEELMK